MVKWNSSLLKLCFLWSCWGRCLFSLIVLLLHSKKKHKHHHLIQLVIPLKFPSTLTNSCVFEMKLLKQLELFPLAICFTPCTINLSNCLQSSHSFFYINFLVPPAEEDIEEAWLRIKKSGQDIIDQYGDLLVTHPSNEAWKKIMAYGDGLFAEILQKMHKHHA